ncbi:MAG: DUF362 domain-containing protein [Deltaproteobacteria bacterium]|nr:DUF362 domain-containing protein [Deltaproteobacteria bacterium]
MKSRVSISHNNDIAAAINGALDHLEGLSELFVGRHVAIKPNDTWASPHDLTACTQADSLRAVIRFVKNYYPKKITVTGGSGAGETDKIFSYLGLDKVIEDEEVEFIDHNRPPFEAVPLEYGPQGTVMVNENVLKYDTLISLAQLKVHEVATVTLTMKNIAMSYPAADYYGHPRNRRLHPHNFFSDMQGLIAGMCKRFRIDLGIITGHPVMIERGPVGGKTFEAGLVIASKDCVAADYIGAKLLGFERVGHIIEAEKLGLGKAHLSNIETIGVQLDEAERIFKEKSKNAQ